MFYIGFHLDTTPIDHFFSGRIRLKSKQINQKKSIAVGSMRGSF